MAEEKNYETVIIGAGPAGMTAALYASRAGLRTVMIDGTAPGGKLLKTYMVDNYPGVPSISGPDLAMQMYEQSVSFGAEFMFGEVESVNKNRQVVLKDGTILNAGSVIIATGAKERLLGIEGEQEAIGHGESFCAVCDAAFFRNKEVVVIGGGNSALEEAQFLTRFASRVTIIIRRDVFRASEKAQREVLENDKIEVIRHAVPKKILMEDGKVTGLVIHDLEDDLDSTIKCDGIFPFIGQIPETEFVKDLGILNDKGYIEADRRMRTAVPGILACGDAIDKDLRQIVTACGDGATAADEAFHFVTDL
ncbi:NAD(P)/FAD-dependent oxidoreductase [Allobaculum mucilyticum]|uniref:NAD(P)/FAD-dependent oxidoreductase n=1 Tax=Allobaculum mucilyticum TaxID=2834459 RepID=UPI001E4BA54D|nr:FAD-dependent oxidoreductase [Allobaculum mucilyticum]UNT97308.1 FAD-dependent oxidoreductase [Allobaculum mucilyticum]